MIIKANMLNMLKVFHDEFKKLELAKNVEDGAQVNKIESISVDGVNQPVTNKNAALNLTDYAKKTDLNVLNTTPSTVEGKIWFEFENHQPVLKIFYGGEVFTLGGAVSYSQDGIYYFSRTGTNLIADLQPEDMIILEDGLALADARFVSRNEFKDLVLTLGDGVTATIRTTTAAAFEHLDTQGRTLTFIDNDERRHPVTFYSDGRMIEGAAITLGSDFADTAFDASTFTTVKAVQSPISIQGGTLASALIGGGGNDTLAGNSGNDTLTGGAGSDLFAVKLTGFADGLTFSDNNFYAGGNSAPIGSVSNFAFQFTNAGAFSVAYGDTISITQLDTAHVDYSLDLDSLNETPTPWCFKDYKPSTSAFGTYTYTTGTKPTYNKIKDAEFPCRNRYFRHSR